MITLTKTLQTNIQLTLREFLIKLEKENLGKTSGEDKRSDYKIRVEIRGIEEGYLEIEVEKITRGIFSLDKRKKKLIQILKNRLRGTNIWTHICIYVSIFRPLCGINSSIDSNRHTDRQKDILFY